VPHDGQVQSNFINAETLLIGLEALLGIFVED
jgi:hypothetical protein